MLGKVKSDITKRKIVLPSILAVAVLLTMVSVTKISAQEETTYPVIVQRLAEKFSLDKDEVKQVFDEVRDEHHADMYALWVERLDSLVADGKLSQTQKDALIAKYEEMHDKRMDLVTLDPEARRAEMQKLHDEFKSWAEDQEIDLSLIGPFAGKKHHLMREAISLR